MGNHKITDPQNVKWNNIRLLAKVCRLLKLGTILVVRIYFQLCECNDWTFYNFVSCVLLSLSDKSKAEFANDKFNSAFIFSQLCLLAFVTLLFCCRVAEKSDGKLSWLTRLLSPVIDKRGKDCIWKLVVLLLSTKLLYFREPWTITPLLFRLVCFSRFRFPKNRASQFWFSCSRKRIVNIERTLLRLVKVKKTPSRV